MERNMNCTNCVRRNTNACDNEALAMAYVPWQKFHETYEPAKALKVGTIFPELDKPFLGRKGVRR